MPLGVEVRTRTAPAARGGSTNTGTWFVAGKATSGPLDAAQLVRSIGDVEAVYGPRDTGNLALYDALDVYFKEGGQRAYVARYTDTGTLTAALALFVKQLGPGQVSAVDETPNATLYAKLLDHAAITGRFAIMDVPDEATITALTTLASAIPQSNSEYGATFGPWCDVPGPASVIGSGPRAVPASPVMAALCARVDNLGNPNRAAAGRDFPLQYVLGFRGPVPTDIERNTLLNAGINMFATVYGVLEMYGFQTAIPQSDINPFWQANCGRARMWLVAQALSVGESYMFKPIDGRGLLQQALKKDLDGILLDLYNVNGLYGETPADAFATEVGVAVNTIDTIAQGELHAVCEARFSLHAKSVIIELVSVPITGAVSVAA